MSQENLENKALERGKLDAQKGLPPREGSKEYLAGYARQYNQDKLSRQQNSPRVLRRHEIASLAESDVDTFYWRSHEGDGFIPK